MTPVTIFLTFTVCVASASDQCHNVTMPQPSMRACINRAATDILEWEQRNAEYRWTRRGYLCEAATVA